MKKFTKILKKKITKIGILSLITTISSFLVFNTSKVNAENITCPTGSICFSYNNMDSKYMSEFYDTLEIQEHLNSLRDYYKNQDDYKHYAIVSLGEYTVNDFGIILFNNDNPNLLLKNVNNSDRIYFNSDEDFIFYYKRFQYKNSYNLDSTFTTKTNSKTMWLLNLFIKGIDFNTYYLQNQSDKYKFPGFILYDSDVDIQLNNFEVLFLDENITLKKGDSFPKYKIVEKPELEFSETPVYKIQNGKLIKSAINLKISMTNYSDNYAFVYKIGEDDNWTTINDSTWTITLHNNANVIAKIIDKTTSEDTGTSYTYTTNSFDNTPSEPTIDDYKIDFNVFNNTISVDTDKTITTSVDVNIKYKVPYDKNYRLGYSLDNGSSFRFFNTSTISSNTNSITFNLKENCNIVAVITDDNDNVVYSSTYTITNITDMDDLKLQKQFNSGDFGRDLYSLNITNNSLYDIPFRIQFGANDFDVNHLPRITDVRGYYYNTKTQERTKSNDVYIKDFKCRSYPNSSEVICEGILTKNSNNSTFYEIIFTNTDNYYLNYYDSFNNDFRNVDVTTSLFKDYYLYRYNMNSNKVYINVKNKNQTNKKGSIIIPAYYLNNDDLDINVSKFDIKKQEILEEYNSYYHKYDYYKQIDFEVTDDIMPVITNKKGKYCFEYYVYDANYKDYLEYSNGKLGYFTYDESNEKVFIPFGNFGKFWFEGDYITICNKEEEVSMYIHKDFIPTFNIISSDEDLTIKDENGNIIGTIDKDFNDSDPYINDNIGFFEKVSQSFKFFTTPIQEVFRIFTSFWNGLDVILQYFFIFIFVFLVALFMFKFIL